jgi:hypothetical protein
MSFVYDVSLYSEYIGQEVVYSKSYASSIEIEIWFEGGFSAVGIPLNVQNK